MRRAIRLLPTAIKRDFAVQYIEKRISETGMSFALYDGSTDLLRFQRASHHDRLFSRGVDRRRRSLAAKDRAPTAAGRRNLRCRRLSRYHNAMVCADGQACTYLRADARKYRKHQDACLKFGRSPMSRCTRSHSAIPSAQAIFTFSEQGATTRLEKFGPIRNMCCYDSSADDDARHICRTARN